jgi:hypothetical protein
VPPGEGVATIEKIAINCAMAGCKPEYAPVVIAALEAMLDPKFGLNRNQCTTAGPAPLAIVSGPVVKKLKLNYGEGATSGAGHRSNATIGRAIRLILWNIGQGKPGQLSKATFGHPGRWSFLIAERPRDDGNPWEEFHVTAAGLSPKDSAVSMFPCRDYELLMPGFGSQSIDNNLYVIHDCISSVFLLQEARQRIFVINPLAANLLAEHGWTKERFRDAIIAGCKRRVREVKRAAGTSPTASDYWTKIADSEDDDAEVPGMLGANDLHLLVSGGWPGAGSNQCLVLTRAHREMVTRKIEWVWE